MNITEKAKNIIDNCRFCWMCRHLCPIGNATGHERNTARARAMAISLVARGATTVDEVIDNVYECSLCGACTNNCMTGFDPKVFVQETKTNAILNGVIPAYIAKLLEKYQATGNVYGEKVCACLSDMLSTKSDVLLLVGQDALYKSVASVKNAVEVLKKAGVTVAVDEKSNDTGAALWFLTGKTEETRKAAENCAAILNTYKTVVVYDPVDLKLMLHEYKEWGIEVKAQVVGFNEYLLGLIEAGKLNVKKSAKEYTVQDNYAYARDLDETETVRKLVEKAGVNKEMLLNRKEANMAGSLIMHEYMPEVQLHVASDRWLNAKNMDCFTVVTENPAEYELLKATAPEGFKVISVEEMILENL